MVDTEDIISNSIKAIERDLLRRIRSFEPEAEFLHVREISMEREKTVHEASRVAVISYHTMITGEGRNVAREITVGEYRHIIKREV